MLRIFSGRVLCGGVISANFIAVRDSGNIRDVIIKRIPAIFLMSSLLCTVGAAATIRATIDMDVHLAMRDFRQSGGMKGALPPDSLGGFPREWSRHHSN